MIVYFTRHGESTANTGNIISNRDLAHPLTEAGREQAAQLAQRLAGAGLSAVYSSPVPRALETATIVSRALDVPLQSVDGLREFDCGVLEGRSGPFAWLRFSRILYLWFERGKLDKRFKGGESYLDIRQRFIALMDELAGRYAQTDARILCVSHGGTLHIGLSALLDNLPPEQVSRWSIPYTTLIKTTYKNGRFICSEWDGINLPQEP